MKITIVKWLLALMLLLLSLGFLDLNFQIVLCMVICIAALSVLWRAVSYQKPIWMVSLIIIAIVTNPIAVFQLSERVLLWLDMLILLTFLVSLAEWKQHPVLSWSKTAPIRPGVRSH